MYQPNTRRKHTRTHWGRKGREGERERVREANQNGTTTKRPCNAEHPKHTEFKHISAVNKRSTRTHLHQFRRSFAPFRFPFFYSIKFYSLAIAFLLLLFTWCYYYCCCYFCRFRYRCPSLPPVPLLLLLPPQCYYFKLLWNREKTSTKSSRNRIQYSAVHIHTNHSNSFLMFTEDISFSALLFFSICFLVFYASRMKLLRRFRIWSIINEMKIKM